MDMFFSLGRKRISCSTLVKIHPTVCGTTTRLFIKMYSNYLSMCLCVGISMCVSYRHSCGGQRTSCPSLFSPPTMWPSGDGTQVSRLGSKCLCFLSQLAGLGLHSENKQTNVSCVSCIEKLWAWGGGFIILRYCLNCEHTSVCVLFHVSVWLLFACFMSPHCELSALRVMSRESWLQQHLSV